MGRPITTRRFVGVGGGAFVAILVFASIVGAGVFVMTLESADPASFVRRNAGFRGMSDPDPAFGQKVRQMYALGGDAAVVTAAASRRQAWPADPEGWLFAALSLERLSEQPGLDAMHARAEADRLWLDLYRRSLNASPPMPNALYMRGWSLMGLGRPLLAREAFGRFLDVAEAGSFGLDSYNRACYLSLAGDAEGAADAWARAATRQNPLLGWAEADPDLEVLHGTFGFEVWHAWNRLRREDARRRLQRDGKPIRRQLPTQF